MLDGDQPAGAEQPPRGPFHGADGGQPVRAAPQRGGRIVLADLGRDRRSHRDIRRVTDHEVNRTVQVAERVAEVTVVERTAQRLLRPGGLVAVEHGAPQGAAVYWVFGEESGWRDTRNNKDLARRDRFVTSAWTHEIR